VGAATPTTTVFRIAPGRGFDDAAALLGADFAGILVRDGWAPYRRFTAATHQTCLAHLLRRCRLLRQDHPRRRLPAQIQTALQQALALRDRVARGAVSPHGLTVARGRLQRQILEALATGSTVPDIQRFVRHLVTEADALLVFLANPAVDATNWRAEHAIRPAVVTRKVCGGNRTARGAETQQILASVLRTLDQRGLDPTDGLTPLLPARQPIVAPALLLPA
jgi:transposase